MKKLILFLFFVIFYGCCIKIYNCPNGEPVRVNRCKNNETLKYYVKDFENKVGSSIKITDKILLNDLGIQTKSSVTLLRDKLTNNTTLIERNLIQYKGKANEYPCDKEIQNRYLQYLEMVTKEIFILKETNEKLMEQANKLNFGKNEEIDISKIIENYYNKTYIH